ncbi:MBL fold metallo-hydrolase [Ralstonia pseudosolanacearum]|uniref:MBL fold metallo-hydrolase n=2 Tax=Ralstonia solanacearum species complex TaxID=3116862 RepID=A0AA92K1Q5_RALSL|nr:MBL fold metallo-hydrolase [Ralstonia pseudosolanacearum]
MPGVMRLRVWDVEHGACAMIQHVTSTLLGGDVGGRLAMIDSGDTDSWRPSTFIRHGLGRNRLDYLFITNADQDHMSDLLGLEDAGIVVPVLFRNPSYTGAQIRQVKLNGGPLTGDAAWYADACASYNQPAAEPFNQYMGGITATAFWNSYPVFTDTNNLSLTIIIRYGPFSILFPGDLEKDGWRVLLQRADFRQALSDLDVLVASHHGRENGFCPELFNFCTPQAIVISDKPIQHDTQRTVPDYRAVVRDTGVLVRTTGKRRHVLTTRRDGTIQFEVFEDGTFHIDTECQG